MIGSILIKMPEITRNYSKSFGAKIINKYFVRVKGDFYIPIFNIPLLRPEILSREDGYKIASKLIGITYRYYEKYLELRKQKQFKVKVFLPEKYGGYALYYLLQKFMIGEATPEEIKIISEFLSRDIFDGKNIDMESLLHQYYMSIWNYDTYKNNILVNTPVGTTPLYISKSLLHHSNMILKTFSNDYYDIAFVNVLTTHFFGKSIQIGSTKFNLLKSIGELDLNWKNVNVISFEELYDISDAIIENNLEGAYPEASYRVDDDMSLSYSSILSVVGNAIDFKNKSVVLLFAMLKRKIKYTDLSEYNDTFYLNKKKDVEYFLISVPFKNIKKFIFKEFIFKEFYTSGIFIIEQDGKTIPVLSNDVGPHWVGVGRENTIIRYNDYSQWYKLLRELASPEHLKKLKKKL